ncbi:MAG: homocysteine S-methyltransferase family protein [Sporomusaceae bacterium]|nr:homocysteine S-methyltransferase family protein [Sporomusaceae bacterium]
MFYVFDGAMGTMLQEKGMPSGYCPEAYNLENPEAIQSIHEIYIASGAQIIESNTFGANRIKLSHYGLAEKVSEINAAAVKIARQAAGTKVKVAGSVGPTGKLIAPLGDLDFETAYEVFAEQIKALDRSGVDLILIETIIDIQEMRAALLAAKAVSTKPVICQLTFGPDGRTVTGTDPQSAAILLEAMGASVIGANCSLGPQQLIQIIRQLSEATSLPISAQPNAGMPELKDGQTVFPLDPESMAAYIPELIAAGATYIGGCCGTTPEHIRAISEVLQKSLPATRKKIAPQLRLTSRSQTVIAAHGLAPILIGERINPTGRKLLQQDIRDGAFLLVKKEALLQVKAGAHVLDVNMGVPGIDQPAAMKKAIEMLSQLVAVPLAIDTTDPKALEAGLRIYPGRALINSVSDEPERIAEFLPLAKKYGAAVLCLPLSSEGVPATAKERLAVVDRIIAAAKKHGLKEEDLLLDALIMTAAAAPTAGTEALKTIELYQQNYTSSITGGLSNISYGLPERDVINSTFCAMAFAKGLNAPIINPYNERMAETAAAAAVLLGHDAGGREFSRKHSKPKEEQVTSPTAEQPILEQIKASVVNGETDSVIPLVITALKAGHTPLEITDFSLTAAMNDVGEAFGSGRAFLPQVLLSAETMRHAFTTIKSELPALSLSSQGKVLLATVKGDIHDLGKNIVAALLENNGFEVIDLGKDVPPEEIVAKAQEEAVDIVGLCALMTTTLPQIDVTIAQIKAAGIPSKVIVGGAVLTADYAESAGSDAYAKDGVAAVNQAKEYCKK